MNENERRVRFGVGGQGVRARFHNAVIRVTLDARPEFWRVFHAAAAFSAVMSSRVQLADTWHIRINKPVSILSGAACARWRD